MKALTNNKWFKVASVTFPLLFTLYFYPVKLTITEQQINIVEVERVCKNQVSDCKYLVYTAQGHTYENTDDIRFLKTLSSDWHGRFGQRGCWNVTTVGIRNGAFNWYPNIVRAKPCSGEIYD